MFFCKLEKTLVSEKLCPQGVIPQYG